MISSSFVCLNWKEQLELGRQFLFGIQAVGEIDATDATVGVDLDTQCFDVIRTVSSACEISKIELDLIPSFIQSHWHGAYKRFHFGRGLIIACSESSPNVLIIQHLHFKCEVLFHIFDNHNQEGELDAKGLGGIHRTSDEIGAHIGSHDLNHT